MGRNKQLKIWRKEARTQVREQMKEHKVQDLGNEALYWKDQARTALRRVETVSRLLRLSVSLAVIFFLSTIVLAYVHFAN